jgi:hypothetical protein
MHLRLEKALTSFDKNNVKTFYVIRKMLILSISML